eukprot:288479-Hanusia_phi.AAC.1
MTFSTWYKQGEQQAKLDSMFAICKTVSPDVKITSKTIDNYVLGAAVDHCALKVQVNAMLPSGTQAIPRVEVLTMRAGKENQKKQKKTKCIVDLELWENNKVTWAANVSETIQACYEANEAVKITQMITSSIPVKEVKIQKSHLRYRSEDQMNMRREISAIKEKIKQSPEADPSTRQLQGQLRDLMESFRQTCIQQDNECFEQ